RALRIRRNRDCSQHRKHPRILSPLLCRRDLWTEELNAMTSQTVDAKPLHASRWAELPERGTPALLRLTGWIALQIGRPFARVLLYPIALYFLVTGQVARSASREYLSRITGRPPRWWDVFRHFHCFAATILDRIYL